MFLDEPTSGLDPVASRDVHDLIASLRERGSPSSSHPPSGGGGEALRSRRHSQHPLLAVGPPEQLRMQLFRSSLVVETAVRLPAPETVFTRDMGVDKWITEGDATYVLTVADPRDDRAEGESRAGGRRGRRGVDRSLAPLAGGRLPPAGRRGSGGRAMIGLDLGRLAPWRERRCASTAAPRSSSAPCWCFRSSS